MTARMSWVLSGSTYSVTLPPACCRLHSMAQYTSMWKPTLLTMATRGADENCTGHQSSSGLRSLCAALRRQLAQEVGQEGEHAGEKAHNLAPHRHSCPAALHAEDMAVHWRDTSVLHEGSPPCISSV